MNVKKGMFLVCIGLVMLTLFANMGYPTFNDWVSNTSAIYENYSGGSIWDRTNQRFINNMTLTGTVPVVTDGITSNSSIGNFTNGYYKMPSNLTLYNKDDNFTITMWIKRIANELGADAGDFVGTDIDALHANFRVTYVGSLESFRFTMTNDVTCDALEVAPPFIVALNTWYLFTVQYDGVKCRTYINTTLYKEVAATQVGAGRADSIFIGRYWDGSGAPNKDFIMNQIVFWNKSLSQDEITYFYNSGLGQNSTYEPTTDDFLILNYINPDFLNISADCDNITMTINPHTSEYPILNCSLYVNDTLTYTALSPLNDSAVETYLNLANGSYGFYWDCYAGSLYNTTINYTLNVMCGYPPAEPCTNCTLYFPITEGWTYTKCLNNGSLYKEKIYKLGCNDCNYSEVETCKYGCEGDKCNLSLEAARINSFHLITLLFAAILIVAMIAKFYR